MQNADLIISIGSRLDTKATGSPISTFAREAKKVVVDIDEFELRKFEHFGLQIDVKILADAKDFIKKLLNTSISSQGYSNCPGFYRITHQKLNIGYFMISITPLWVGQFQLSLVV